MKACLRKVRQLNPRAVIIEEATWHIPVHTLSTCVVLAAYYPPINLEVETETS